MSAAPRFPLPTREQIQAITVRADLEAIRDAVDRTVAKIETDLGFGDGDDDWAARARSALAVHRYTLILIGRRLKGLGGGGAFSALAGVRGVSRERVECDPLTWELIDGFTIDLTTITTEAEALDAIGEMNRRIEAIEFDRADEIARFVAQARDESWMAISGAALKAAKAVRQELSQKVVGIRREAKDAAKLARIALARRENDTHACQFVDVARERLPRETYLAFWDEANRRMDAEGAQHAGEPREGQRNAAEPPKITRTPPP